jgi:hypothetical protein
MSNEIELQRNAVMNCREYKKTHEDAPAYLLPQHFLQTVDGETIVLRVPPPEAFEDAEKIGKANAEAALALYREVFHAE